MSKAIVRKPEIVDNLSITTSGLSDREWAKAAIAEETEFRAASIRNAAAGHFAGVRILGGLAARVREAPRARPLLTAPDGRPYLVTERR